MATISFTKQQRRAIEITGRSVIVSAAAGSGKTAVLAERCAYLVCDAPAEFRCDVDQLLVLTFTEAAASQMRVRINEALHARITDQPQDVRLREQAALVDGAQISTIHAFCLWLVRRWFTHIGIDPTASVLGRDEESVLKREVLDQLFTDLYGQARVSNEPLGNVEDLSGDGGGGTAGNGDVAAARAFVKLVDDYGLGEDRGLTTLVLRLANFVESLPDPDEWLCHAHESLVECPVRIVHESFVDLATELSLQIEQTDQIAAGIEAGDSVGAFYATRIRAYADQLRAWKAMLGQAERGADADEQLRSGNNGLSDIPVQCELVRSEILGYEFGKQRAPSLASTVDPAVRAARDAAAEELKRVKERYFGKRLRDRFARFSPAELAEGITKTAPYVATITQLVDAFRKAYASRKRELNVLDFADQERFAWELLRSDTDPAKPSEIARTLHRRFVHVLVDEFQDISPLQRAIIGLVSRESDAQRANNLFAVGDVKQSIYRFRLAEPAIFTERLNRFRDESDDGATVFLQSNFRSRRDILESVNVVFASLMREGFADTVYDRQARLEVGRDDDAAVSHQPTELHVLESRWTSENEDEGRDDERGTANLRTSERWSSAEREAYLIGLRIRALMDRRAAPSDGSPPRYRDMVILLRSARIDAERMAAMLTSMCIPAYADVGGSLFAAREVGDVIAALRVLDNPCQDIPLAAVLRSGVFAAPFSEDELVMIRCLDRAIPFHAVVQRYACDGDHEPLRERVENLLDRIEALRKEVRCRPLADVLWRLYHRRGYLAYAGGLPNGAQRRANLLKVHQLARQFGTFRRQGLHRFLRFIEWLEDEKRDVASAPALGEAEDVVRIMTIHQAKGLEFPVVFIAGLGTKFNLGDRNSRMIFDRNRGIGLRVVDPQRMIEYPSVVHTRVVEEIERTARQEELCILYVAMTRARDRLILVGSASKPQRFASLCGLKQAGAPPLLAMLTATTPLDWLILVLRSAGPDVVRSTALSDGTSALFTLDLHDADEMKTWRVTSERAGKDDAMLVAASRGDMLPADEPVAASDPAVERVLGRIDYVYPHLVSTSIRATYAAAEIEHAYDSSNESKPRQRGHQDCDFDVPASKYAPGKPPDAVSRGVVTHRVLQHLDFRRAADGVAAELQRMTQAGWIGSEDAALVDQSSIAWFLSTPLAEAIRGAGDGYRREFLYTSAEPLEGLDRSVHIPTGDHVLVRGMVDGILPVSDGIEIIDFKTDAISSEQVAARAETYRPQVTTYARAMAQIWRRPVRACTLVFLSARRCHAWHDGTWAEGNTAPHQPS